MPVTTSLNLGYQIPGSIEGDNRHEDLIAIQDALVFLDNVVGTYIENNVVPFSVAKILRIECDVDTRMNLSTSISNNLILIVRTVNVPDGTPLQWSITSPNTKLHQSIATQVAYVVNSSDAVISDNKGVANISVTHLSNSDPVCYFDVSVAISNGVEINIDWFTVEYELYYQI